MEARGFGLVAVACFLFILAGPSHAQTKETTQDALVAEYVRVVLAGDTILSANSLGDYAHFQVSPEQANDISSVEYQQCLSSSLSNFEAVQCMGDESHHLDVMLNASYRAAIAKMPNSHSETLLRESQRQWLKDKDAICEQEVRAVGPTPYNMVGAQCAIDELIRRIAWLQNLGHR